MPIFLFYLSSFPCERIFIYFCYEVITPLLMTIAEFKQLLNIPVEASQEAIQSRFAMLAEALFRDFQIEKGGEVYDLLEIEFYFWKVTPEIFHALKPCCINIQPCSGISGSVKHIRA